MALEALIEAKLACERYDEALARLVTLIAEHPYRERFRAQQMLALYRADRQAEALQAYRDACAALMSDLGIEPGERLRGLERAILAHDPALAPGADREREAPPCEPPPLELPPPPPLRALTRTRMFGRSLELARLQQLWDGVGRGSGGAMAIAGEAGIGKSRLTAELAGIAHDGGGLVLYGRCDEGLVAPYQPFKQALGPLVDAVGVDRLHAELGRRAFDLAALFTELAPAAERAPRDPSTQQLALFDAVAALVTLAAGTRRVLMVLDDLHWTPKPTLMMLRHLIRLEPPRLLVVVTYRDTEVGGDHSLMSLLGELRADRTIEPMILQGLQPSAVAALLQATAPGLARREAGLPDRLHGDTNGNPLFVRELLAHLIEAGAPTFDAPDQVRDLIARRVARLSEASRRALAVAAVVGEAFSVSIVEHALDGDDDLLDALDEATAARLVTEAGHGDYLFAHALVRQTIYDRLSAARRAPCTAASARHLRPSAATAAPRAWRTTSPSPCLTAKPERPLTTRSPPDASPPSATATRKPQCTTGAGWRRLSARRGVTRSDGAGSSSRSDARATLRCRTSPRHRSGCGAVSRAWAKWRSSAVWCSCSPQRWRCSRSSSAPAASGHARTPNGPRDRGPRRSTARSPNSAHGSPAQHLRPRALTLTTA